MRAEKGIDRASGTTFEGSHCADHTDEEKHTCDLTFDEFVPFERIIDQVYGEQNILEDARVDQGIDREVKDGKNSSVNGLSRVDRSDSPEDWGQQGAQNGI